MPVMDPERWRSLESLIDRALDLEPAARERWLAELRGESPDIVDEVTALLAGDVEAERDGFLASPVAGEASLRGMQLGAWMLEQPLGAGGMGTVWLARRTDGHFEGRAAVKLLSLALVTPQGQASFRREGSALARLAHPGIARLLDAGVVAGAQPYLVLEHVEGTRIDEYVRARGSTRAECVTLVLQVLDAVEHAHANLVVHRDIKPSNVLVTPQGCAKLLDFGIAKLLDAEEGDVHTARTAGHGSLTPAFAAPEQAAGAPVTTAMDVYAVGVLLYLLLSGRHPTGEGARSPDDALAALRERTPASLGIGDLDLVLAHALRKEPAERYQTAAALADDLARWLRHEPVRARPTSVAYRARKFVRRNPSLVAAALAVVLVTSAYVWSVRRDRERVHVALTEARVEAGKAAQVAEFAVGLFDAGDRPVAADTVSTREQLARGLAEARALRGQPEVQAQMLDVVGRIHTVRGTYLEAQGVLREALTLRERALGPDHPDVASSLVHLAAAHTGGREADALVRDLRRAFDIRRSRFGDEDPRTLDALYALASAMHTAGDHPGASRLRDAWAQAAFRGPPQVTAMRARQLLELADIRAFGGRAVEAERLVREAIAMRRALYGDDHHRVGSAYQKLGTILSGGGRAAEADTVLRRAIDIHRRRFPDGHPLLGIALVVQGGNLQRLRRHAEAEAAWREGAALEARFHGAVSRPAAVARIGLGAALGAQGRLTEAEAELRAVLATQGAFVAPPTLAGARARVFLGDVLRTQGQLDEAEALLREGHASMLQYVRIAPAFARFAHEALAQLEAAKGKR